MFSIPGLVPSKVSTVAMLLVIHLIYNITVGVSDGAVQREYKALFVHPSFYVERSRQT